MRIKIQNPPTNVYLMNAADVHEWLHRYERESEVTITEIDNVTLVTILDGDLGDVYIREMLVDELGAGLVQAMEADIQAFKISDAPNHSVITQKN